MLGDPAQIVGRTRNWGERRNGSNDGGGGGRGKKGKESSSFPPFPYSFPPPSPPPSFILTPQFPLRPTISPCIVLIAVSVVFCQHDIESVILVGGGTRVPKVQELLLKTVQK